MMLKNLKSNEDIKLIEKTINAKLDYLMSRKENNCNHKCKNDGACRC